MQVNKALPLFALFAAITGTAGAQQLTQWQPNDGLLGDAYGRSVTMDQGLAVIGAPNQFAIGQQRGKAYVIEVATGQHLARLETNLATAGAGFGEYVALEGGLAVVAAPNHSQLGNSQGAAYVFDAATGQLLHELVPDNPAAFTRFGSDLALDGGLAIVGRSSDNQLAQNAGAAYIYDAPSGSLLHKLLPSDGEAFANFGLAVAIDGTRVLVSSRRQGAPADSDGRVYVFDTITGLELLSFESPAPGTQDSFGYHLALEGDLAAVSARNDVGVPGSADTVYLFDVATGALVDQLQAPAPPLTSDFGSAVEFDQGRLFIGNPSDGTAQTGAGVVYVYEPDAQDPSAGLLPDPAGSFMRLGSSIAVDGDTLLAGAPSFGSGLGSAFVYDIAGLPAGTDFCFGEACPCGNDGAMGAGCANSVGSGGTLASYGYATTGGDNWSLRARNLPPSAFGLVAMGSGSTGALVLNDGLLCLGGRLYRLGDPQLSSPSGTLQFGPGLVAESCQVAPGACIAAGSTWFFQVWYRDLQGPCGGGSNLTNGLSVSFAP